MAAPREGNEGTGDKGKCHCIPFQTSQILNPVHYLLYYAQHTENTITFKNNV